MPVTPWGQKIDIISNPLGVIGRMNLAQIMEAYLGLISWKVREDILKNSSQKNIISLITNVYKNILDKSKDQIISKTVINIIKKMNKSSLQSYIDNLKSQKGLPWIYPSYASPSFDDIMKALKMVGLKDKYILELPNIGKGEKSKIPVAIGYVYMYKMEHMSSKKISSRSTGKYVTKLMQPTAGKKAQGGQRVGEFDSWSLFAHGATNLIKEMFGPQSDDYLSKNEIISNIIENGYAHNIDKLKKTPTRDLLEIYFRLMLLDFK
jgi:DNA-directed RNA polymerase subunit beta